MGERGSAVPGPLPVGAPIQLVGQCSNFALGLRVLVKIGSRSQHAGQQESRIDRGQLTLPDTLPGCHVKKVVVKAFVAGGLRLGSLGAVAKKAQGGERPLHGLGTSHEGTLDPDRIGRQGQTDRRDTGGGAFLGLIRHQSVNQVRFVDKVVEGLALE